MALTDSRSARRFARERGESTAGLTQRRRGRSEIGRRGLGGCCARRGLDGHPRCCPEPSNARRGRKERRSISTLSLLSMKTTLCLLALLLAGSTGSLMAAESKAKPTTDFKSLDTDRDGRISLQEFTTPAAKERAKEGAKGTAPTDKDQPAGGDGIVSPTSTVQGRYTPEVFRILDVDHDQFLSPTELEALVSSAHKISQP